MERMLKVLMLTILVFSNIETSASSRLPRLQKRQAVDPSCSACEKRLRETPPQVCCRCIDQGATCNNDIATNETNAGLACIECELFNDCKPGQAGCKVQDITIVEVSDIFDLRQKDEPKCSASQKLCCNPGPGGGFEKQLKIVDAIDLKFEAELIVDTQAICEDSKLSAVQDFGHGVTCGKRDSRVYYDAELEESYTNPGEWPWAVLIFNNGRYLGAGALMDNDVVVTVGHKVKDFVSDPSGLTVRLGDWNPNEKDKIEEHPHIEVPVKCVKLHPDADLSGSLANNVAVLKLRAVDVDVDVDPRTKSVSQVVGIRTGPKRPANNPEGVKGSSVVGGVSALDEALGLVSDVPEAIFGLRQNREVPRSYINTVCLPKSEDQFEDYEDNCWVAAWGQDLKRQREVDLPLVSKSDCERRLGPTFKEKGLENWRSKRSEVCAGGVPGKDTCQGEGGAPLVCYDKDSDLYFAVGLVNYGFECNTDKPAVYTNLADPSIKEFITAAFSNNDFC
eukprot:GFUD01011851.1.p1 GENE.GFUD01011851.1~~GFUD01011851.1.p1  ORF type:complete len:506 (+),score=110.36 GFUD01011851.1:173-1690(+)